MTVKEKFLRYVQVETTSEATCETCPSSPNQLVLANMLVAELQAMGVTSARVDEHGYVYATIPARPRGRARLRLRHHPRQGRSPGEGRPHRPYGHLRRRARRDEARLHP